jgi:hypothetical protein
MEDAPKNDDINVDEIIKEEESKKPKPIQKDGYMSRLW